MRSRTLMVRSAATPRVSGRCRASPVEPLGHGTLLPPRFAAAGVLGVLHRAEPARALADMHLDLGVPAAGRLVIDAFAGAVDVALDGAVGRGRDRAGGRRQQ